MSDEDGQRPGARVVCEFDLLPWSTASLILRSVEVGDRCEVFVGHSGGVRRYGVRAVGPDGEGMDVAAAALLLALVRGSAGETAP